MSCSRNRFDDPQRPSAVIGPAAFQQHAVFARLFTRAPTCSDHAPSKCSCRTAGGRRGNELGRSASDRIRKPSPEIFYLTEPKSPAVSDASSPRRMR